MKLPEKGWYNLRDVAQRWGTDADHVLHFVESGKLVASIKVNIGTWLEKLVIDSNGKYQGSVDADGRYQGGIAEYRTSAVLMDILSAAWFDWKALRKSTDGYDISRNTIIGCRTPVVFWGFKEPYYIVPDDLLFTAQEIARFEAEHGLNESEVLKESAGNKKADTESKESTRATETLQKMLTAIAMDAYRYTPGNKQNGDAMKDLQAAFVEAGLDISDNTIRKHLKSGTDLLDRQKSK